MGLVTFIQVPAFSAVSFKTNLTLTVKGTLMWVALSKGVAGITSIQTNVFTHTCALIVHHVQITGTHEGTRGVAAGHVPATRCGHLTFIHIITDKTITLVAGLALTDVGSIRIEARRLSTTVV